MPAFMIFLKQSLCIKSQENLNESLSISYFKVIKCVVKIGYNVSGLGEGGDFHHKY